MSPANGPETSGSLKAAATVFMTTEDCQWIRALLAMDGVDVIQTAGLEEAIQALALVILLDADGHPDSAYALRRLMERKPTARVVVLARQADNRMWVEVLSQGAHDLLAKPLFSSEVRSAVLGALQTERRTAVGARA
jgi:FixJ family two-component response regulator